MATFQNGDETVDIWVEDRGTGVASYITEHGQTRKRRLPRATAASARIARSCSRGSPPVGAGSATTRASSRSTTRIASRRSRPRSLPIPAITRPHWSTRTGTRSADIRAVI
jgi:hypothetical protein